MNSQSIVDVAAQDKGFCMREDPMGTYRWQSCWRRLPGGRGPVGAAQEQGQ
ncbi:MAG: hypothetical protein WCG85_22880 [Polyangia bacterium]